MAITVKDLSKRDQRQIADMPEGVGRDQLTELLIKRKTKSLEKAAQYGTCDPTVFSITPAKDKEGNVIADVFDLGGIGKKRALRMRKESLLKLAEVSSKITAHFGA